LVVAHAPSDTRAKGTDFIRAAVRQVNGLEYIEATGRTHSEITAALARADLVVDQLSVGAHGVLAVEALSMAKPVVCYLLPELVATMPADCPIINADPSTLADVLSAWTDRRAELHALGIRSRSYAERHHDVKVVARRLIDAYAALPG
jgi:glycosyltransferase involved in cell wall biosynthesis